MLELGFKPGDEPIEAVIKKKYRQLALKFHPDKNPTEEAKAKFIAIEEAYKYLLLPRHEQVEEEQIRPFPSSAYPESLEEVFRNIFSPKMDDEYQYHIKRKFKNKCVIEGNHVFRNIIQLESESLRLFKDCIELTIDNKNLKLPAYGADIILRGLLKNQNLLKVSYPKNLFDAEQIAKLEAHLTQVADKLIKIRKQEANKKRERTMLLIGACAGVWLPKIAVIGAALSRIGLFGSILLGTLCGYGLLKIHQAYLKYAAKQYNTPSKILAVNSPSEKAALFAGINAKNTKVYLKSFFIKATYQHPLAFAAGLFHSLEYNEVLIDSIRSAYTKQTHTVSAAFSRETPYARNESAGIAVPSFTYCPSQNDKVRDNSVPSQAASMAHQKRNVPMAFTLFK